MTTLYVTEQGAVLHRTHQRIVVTKHDQTLEVVRLSDLERVVLLGSVQMTSSAMLALLEGGVETSFLSLGGKFRGRLAPAEAKNIFLRQAQFRRYEDMTFRLTQARTSIGAKIRNARSLVHRHHRNSPCPAFTEALAALEASHGKLAGAADLDTLMGVEGEAAKTYFCALGTMVRSEFAFTGRSRRPPQDPMNALLSFGYTLVLSELVGAIAATGLDPHVGYLHSLDYGRPSLALDLLEEFRQPVVDRLALSLVNRGVLTQKHFAAEPSGGVLLNDTGRPPFLEYYHRALSAEFSDRASGQTLTFRKLLRRQAERVRQAILDESEYEPYLAR